MKFSCVNYFSWVGVGEGSATWWPLQKAGPPLLSLRTVLYRARGSYGDQSPDLWWKSRGNQGRRARSILAPGRTFGTSDFSSLSRLVMCGPFKQKGWRSDLEGV